MSDAPRNSKIAAIKRAMRTDTALDPTEVPNYAQRIVSDMWSFKRERRERWHQHIYVK